MSAAKKIKTLSEIQPEHVSTGWIAKKHTLSTSTIRREIKSGALRAELTTSGEFRVLFKDYEEWKARYFKVYVQS